jgi:Zn-dependent peptidase ImmA (M78 family)
MLRRGFKAAAERIAVEVRSELGLAMTDALSAHALADHLGVPLVALSAVPSTNGAGFRAFFQVTDPDSFSALTIFNGTARLIVHNDAHHPHRQASNICHEIAHCLLEHPPAPLLGDGGCRERNDTLEAEADWLGGALLVPREGGLSLIKRAWSVPEIADHYGVSEQLCRWRLNNTGVMRQARR